MCIKIYIVLFMVVFLSACNMEKNGYGASSYHQKPERDGLVSMAFDTVPECNDVANVVIHFAFIWQDGTKDTETVEFNPLNPIKNWNYNAPLNVSMTLTIDPNLFRCNGMLYSYETPSNNIFTLSNDNSEISFTVSAHQMGNNNNFHFAVPGESNDSNKWSLGKLAK